MKFISDLNHLGLPRSFVEFFAHEGFMTPQLKELGELRVEVLHEQDDYALNSFEKDCLAEITSARLREVCLYVDDRPLLYARTLIPEETLKALGGLLELGATPLGELLEKHQAKRSPLQFAEIESGGVLYQQAMPHADFPLASTFARWSVFTFPNQARLIVFEVVLGF